MSKQLSAEQTKKIQQFLAQSRNFDQRFWQALQEFEGRIKTKSPLESNKATYQTQGKLLDPATRQKAREIMEATGISSERDAIILVFCRYQPEFLRWWNS